MTDDKRLLSSVIWDQRDSNPRPRDYESPALPLRHSPNSRDLIYHQNSQNASQFF